MNFTYFSKNGELLPVAEATVPLSNIEYQYGFGVYETIRVTNRIPYFQKQHLERLMESARIIELLHPFSEKIVSDAISELIEKNNVETCNLKILLIGAPSTPFDKTQGKLLKANKTKEEASLYILCLNPLFPDKKLYKEGVHCITYQYERLFPHAKTLNMLGSYLAYRKAKEAGAYDALLLNHKGHILEGTRTNFFCIKGRTIFSPPEADILLGVTRQVLIRAASVHGYIIKETAISLSDLKHYDGAFITSTSSKILPIHSIDSHVLGAPSPELRELISLFDTFLTSNGGTRTN